MLVRKILFPISLLYALVVLIRNYLYDSDVKKASVFKTKTICIGNLSVGGTGKTPMIEYLIRQLKNEHKIAVLSRGYKRKSSGFLLADTKSTVATIGDEPFQIRTKFKDITVAVDADRRNGISILEDKIGPDVILLDDAFQHRKVKAGFNMLLTAYGKLYCDDWCIPTGNLRDNRREARRADVIVVTKCPATMLEHEREGIRRKLKPRPNQQVLFSTLKYDTMFQGKDTSLSVTNLKEKKLTLVTGIADPAPLVAYLQEQGLAFEHMAYADHHFFTSTELKALNEKEIVITTEKDYMRLKDTVAALYYIPVQHEFNGYDAHVLTTALEAFMKQDV